MTLEERIQSAILGYKNSGKAKEAIEYIIWALEQETNDSKSNKKE